MLLVGQLNYGKRGILDITHTRLFTFRTFRQLFEQGGFDVVHACGIPAPFPLAVGQPLGGMLITINAWLIRLRATMFSYQSLFVLQARPGLDYLLQQAQLSAAERAARDTPPATSSPASSPAPAGAPHDAEQLCD